MRKDLIHYPYDGVTKHEKMSAWSRASQFTPFSALTGYNESIADASKQRDVFRKPGEDDLAGIEEKAQYIQAHIKERPEVILAVFAQDEKKDSGKYEKIHGHVKTIDLVERTFHMTDRTIIRMDQIVNIIIFDKPGS